MSQQRFVIRDQLKFVWNKRTLDSVQTATSSTQNTNSAIQPDQQCNHQTATNLQIVSSQFNNRCASTVINFYFSPCNFLSVVLLTLSFFWNLKHFERFVLNILEMFETF
jgi:hypothetical protein